MADADNEQTEAHYGVTFSDVPAEDRARARALRRKIVMVALILAMLAAIAAAVTVFAVRGERRSAPASTHVTSTLWSVGVHLAPYAVHH
jgi:flagellar basal body-associated protein FliL